MYRNNLSPRPSAGIRVRCTFPGSGPLRRAMNHTLGKDKPGRRVTTREARKLYSALSSGEST